MNRMTLLGAALATLAFGCADERPPAVVPGALMASAPAASMPSADMPSAAEMPSVQMPSPDAIADGMPQVGEPPADHPAYAAAIAPPVPNRTERALGIEPAPEPPANAPPLRVHFRATRRSSTGSSEPTMDADAPVPKSAGCAGGLRGLSGEFPWGGSEGGVWRGTGHPDPEPLEAISDSEMLALAGDVGLDSPDREHALVSIGRRHVPGAMVAFRDSLDPGQPRSAREMALSGLIEHGGSDALRLMWQALTKDPTAQIRGMAIWGIALYGADEATKAITTGLEDPTYDVQGMALLAVWAIKDRPSVALPILEAAARADERRLWQEGLNVLARMPYSDAGNLLRDLAYESKGQKRNSAVFYYRQWRSNHPDLCQ